LPDACYQNQGTIGDCEHVIEDFVCIIITKEIVSGPRDTVFDFTGGYEPFSLGDGESYYILSAPGVRQVTEVLPPTWQQTGFDCEGGTITRSGTTATFNPSAGDFLRCTVSNAFRDPRSQNREVPNIGAGLSGLFNGQPTPLPTAPAAVAPAATSPVITPPRTGDGGLAD
jgi:hypothetical protein